MVWCRVGFHFYLLSSISIRHPTQQLSNSKSSPQRILLKHCICTLTRFSWHKHRNHEIMQRSQIRFGNINKLTKTFRKRPSSNDERHFDQQTKLSKFVKITNNFKMFKYSSRENILHNNDYAEVCKLSGYLTRQVFEINCSNFQVIY